MSEVSNVFDQYVLATKTLKDIFHDKLDSLIKSESKIEFSFSSDISSCNWLKENLIKLVKDLCPAELDIKVKIEVQDFEGKLTFIKEANDISDLKCNFTWIDSQKEEPVYHPSNEAKTVFDSLKGKYKTNMDDIKFKDIYNLLESLERNGEKPKLNVDLSIYKEKINNRILKNIEERDRQYLICYLFPSSFISALESISIGKYEEEFYKQNKRTIIIIFDWRGYIGNDFLTILGSDNVDKIGSKLIDTISEKMSEKYKKIINLRKSHGDFRTSLVPEMLFIERCDYNESAKVVVDKLNCLQATLSAIYLASRVDIKEEREENSKQLKIKTEYCVEYKKGGKAKRLLLSPNKFVDFKLYLQNIYELYAYAYSVFSIDKLDLCEKFISSLVNDIEYFCKNAEGIKEATKNGYENILLERTSDYFDARQKVQDTIKGAIKDVSDNTVTLTKETAKEVYTIFGIAVLGLIATALKPDTQNIWITALIISLILSLYMFLILGYYLETLKEMNELRLKQHNSYIESFKDILGEIVTKDFINDENVKESNQKFLDKWSNAQSIYLAILMISLIVLCISLYEIVNG
jgi:hypothetical protein